MKPQSLILASLAALTLCGATALSPPTPPPTDARGRVAQRVTALFTDDAMGETRALLVLKNGVPIVERYGPGFTADAKLISWSMAKSITAILAGLLVADGRLALDEPVDIAAWQRIGDPRGEITLRQLLHMSAGLDHRETDDPAYNSDTARMLLLDGAQDMAAYAEGRPLEARPGERFEYSSATSVIVADVIAGALTRSDNPRARRDAMLRFIRGRLTQPLGVDSLTPEFDAAGTMIGGSIMHATARDYARFGELLRLGGQAERGGPRILPQRWIDFMLTPSANDAGYGGHLWLNRARPPGSGVALWPGRGDEDVFAMLGHQGQFVVVAPSQGLTVVRLGISTEAEIAEVREALRLLIAEL